MLTIRNILFILVLLSFFTAIIFISCRSVYNDALRKEKYFVTKCQVVDSNISVEYCDFPDCDNVYNSQCTYKALKPTDKNIYAMFNIFSSNDYNTTLAYQQKHCAFDMKHKCYVNRLHDNITFDAKINDSAMIIFVCLCAFSTGLIIIIHIMNGLEMIWGIDIEKKYRTILIQQNNNVLLR